MARSSIAGWRGYRPWRSPGPATLVWVGVFFYAAAVAAVVQLVLLPRVFPSWDAGDGLLVGGDWVSFHRIAVELSQRIRGEGWSAWQLRPEGQAPAGIAAAVYALTVPKPWTIIPINAALFATAAVALMRIVQLFLPNPRHALLCVLPFVFYPSAMVWYAQIHKDVYAGAGTLMFIHGWASLARPETWLGRKRAVLQPLVGIALGTVLVWVVRPYEVLMMQGIAAALLPLVATVHLRRALRRALPWTRAAVALLLLAASVVAMGRFTETPVARSAPTPAAAGSIAPSPVAISGVHPVSDPGPASVRGEATSPGPAAAGAAVSSPVPLGGGLLAHLAAVVEARAGTLAGLRSQFLDGYPDSASLIDGGVRLHTALDVVRYLPRAVEIALLAPFPDQWLGRGSLASNTAMRRLSALEMAGVYLSLPMALYALFRWRDRIEVWAIWLFCPGMMAIYAIATPNVGSLYRVRYQFVMVLMALGIAAVMKMARAGAAGGRGDRSDSEAAGGLGKGER